MFNTMYLAAIPSLSAPLNLVTDNYLTYTKITGPWKIAYNYYTTSYVATVTNNVVSRSTVVVGNSNVTFDSCSGNYLFSIFINKLALNTGNPIYISLAGSTGTTPTAGFTITTSGSATVYTSVSNSTLSSITIAAGASRTYLFPVATSQNTAFAALVSESNTSPRNTPYHLATTPQDTLQLYWQNEACASASSNLFTHGTSSGGKYYSVLKPVAVGYYSLTVVNSGASSVTYDLKTAFPGKYYPWALLISKVNTLILLLVTMYSDTWELPMELQSLLLELQISYNLL
jgi:hypothetical protein